MSVSIIPQTSCVENHSVNQHRTPLLSSIQAGDRHGSWTVIKVESGQLSDTCWQVTKDSRGGETWRLIGWEDVPDSSLIEDGWAYSFVIKCDCGTVRTVTQNHPFTSRRCNRCRSGDVTFTCPLCDRSKRTQSLDRPCSYCGYSAEWEAEIRQFLQQLVEIAA